MSDLFDPAALYSLSASLDDDSTIVEVDQDELKRVAGAEARRRCASLKLAARIVGLATANSAELSDEDVLESMGQILSRVAELREVALKLVEADRDSEDYSATFNAVTSAMLDVATEEWKWSRLAPGATRTLPPATVSKLLERTIQFSPERFDFEFVSHDMATLRRLAVLEAMPKVYGLANLFDYFQPSPDDMVRKFLQAIIKLAELHAELMADPASPEFTYKAILVRFYGISTGVLCEVFKAEAAADVARLRALPEIDRSLQVAQYERLGGMNYNHIIDKHQQAMDRLLDTANLILETRQRSR